MKEAKVSVSSTSNLFSLNTILLSCVAVSTGPEDANENTSGFLVGAGWSSTSQSKVTNSQLADFVVQAPLTHSSSASNPLSSSYEDLSASVSFIFVFNAFYQRGCLIPSLSVVTEHFSLMEVSCVQKKKSTVS